MTRTEARREWSRAEDELAEAAAYHKQIFDFMFPVGSHALYTHGEHAIRVEVLEHHDYLERLRVRSLLSRKEFWLDAGRMVIPAGEEADRG